MIQKQGIREKYQIMPTLIHPVSIVTGSPSLPMNPGGPGSPGNPCNIPPPYNVV